MKYFLIFFISLFVFAQEEDPYITQQKDACSKKPGSTWSAQSNRCVEKEVSIETRNDANACQALTNLESRKACNLKLATDKSQVDAGNAESSLNKMSDKQNQSAIINGANTVVSVINMVAGKGKDNDCLSKKMFGVTAVAGTLSDIYLKIKTKTALNELKDKYQIDLKTNSYNAQYKALEYLRDEQQTVAEIAGLEKKRQMLLMIGYGATAAVAAYETFGSSPSCYKKEVAKQEPQAQKKVAPEAPEQQAAQPEPAPKPDAPAPAPAPAAAEGATSDCEFKVEGCTNQVMVEVSGQPVPAAVEPELKPAVAANPEVTAPQGATVTTKPCGSYQCVTLKEGDTTYAVHETKGQALIYPANTNGQVSGGVKPVGTANLKDGTYVIGKNTGSISTYNIDAQHTGVWNSGNQKFVPPATTGGK